MNIVPAYKHVYGRDDYAEFSYASDANERQCRVGRPATPTAFGRRFETDFNAKNDFYRQVESKIKSYTFTVFMNEALNRKMSTIKLYVCVCVC